MVSPLLIVILVFLVYLLLYSFNPLYVDIMLMIVFIWAYPNLSEKQAGYYLILLMFALIFSLINKFYAVDQEKKGSLFGFNFQGFNFLILNLVIAIPVLLVMAWLQGGSKTAILGVVTFASMPFGLQQALSPMISGLLGMIENRFIFTLVDVFKYFFTELMVFPVLATFFVLLSPVLPVLFAGFLFAVLHVSAYSYVVINLIFAFIVVVIWIVSYLGLKNSVVADATHYWWNVFSVLGRQLKIVTGGGSGLPVA